LFTYIYQFIIIIIYYFFSKWTHNLVINFFLCSAVKVTWAEGMRRLMGEKGLMEEDWNDRGNWRKKIL